MKATDESCIYIEINKYFPRKATEWIAAADM